MEQVILVNEQDEVVGQMEKMEAHLKGILHRAFSVFIFNSKGEMLLQQRALDKYHSAGLWTNACCSHPRPGEGNVEAAQRRLKEELGFSIPLKKVFDFTYKTKFANGLTEHEVDHVFIGVYDGVITPVPQEVADYKFLSMDQIVNQLKTHPENYTSWFHIAFPKIQDWQMPDSEKLRIA
jgi:isopentenyl-diphosphate delta-isomerase